MSEPTAALDLKDLLLRERENIRGRHAAGALGGQVATTLTDLNDRIIVEAFRRAMEQASGNHRLSLLEDEHAAKILQRHPDRVVRVPMPNAAFDLETPADLQALHLQPSSEA